MNGFESLLASISLEITPGPVKVGDSVYLYGPRSTIVDVTPLVICSGKGEQRSCSEQNVYSLGWLDKVDVLAVRGSRIKFGRPMGWHARNIGWAPLSSVLRRADFAYIKTWDAPGTYSYCDDQAYCFELDVEADATFTWRQVSSKDDSCSFWLNNDWKPCTVHGYVFKARDILLFEATDGNGEFMKAVPGGLCRVREKVDHWMCDSSSTTFQAQKPAD